MDLPGRCLLAAMALCASLAPADTVDDLVGAALKAQHVPGAWVVVIRDGKVIKRKGYGLANLEHQVPVGPETLMQTGSIGKMFTATGVLLLAQDGKLKLSDSIADHFPGSPDWWKKVTIRHLLTHTGGVPDYEGDEYSVDLHKEYSEDDLVKFAQAMKPDFAPGEQWRYSNTDYMLLGVLIHRLTGKPYWEFLRERVWGPAGMPTIRSVNDAEVIPHRSAGYDWLDGAWRNQDWVSASLNSTADGTLYAAPDDFIAWDKALDQFKVLPKSLQEEAWTSARLNDGSECGYGYAWAVGDRFGHRFVSHSGGWQGFRSDYVRYRDERLSVVVFENCGSAAPARLTAAIAEALLPDLSVKNKPPLPESKVEVARFRPVLDALAAGHSPPSGSPIAENFTPPAPVLAVIKSQLGELGKLRAVDLIWQSKKAVGVDLVFRLAYEKRTLAVKVGVDRQGKYTTFSGY